MQKRLLLLTGSPGVGKTTVLLKVVESLRNRGYSVDGMVSREVRLYGERVGFEILDLSSGRHGWLAHINRKNGPQIGRYRVNLSDLNDVGVNAIVEASGNADVIAIDEIGPMELFSSEFKDAVRSVVRGRKIVVGVVHWKARNALIDEVNAREDVNVFAVTRENRDRLHKRIVEDALKLLKATRHID